MKALNPRGSGRKKGICLTVTDHAVLDRIGKQGFQSFKALSKGPLKSVSPKHAWKRLRQLKEAGLLCTVLTDGGMILGWTLAKAGIKRFPLLPQKGWNLEYRPPIYKTSFHHDEALREVRLAINNAPCIRKWVPEHVLKAQANRKLKYRNGKTSSDQRNAIPDALLTLRHNGVDYNAALEVELTRKSKRRLYLKLEDYVIRPDLSLSFFVVKGEDLLEILSNIYKEVLQRSFKAKLKTPQNGVYFIELSELLRDGVWAKFRGNLGSIILGEWTP